jgi:uncharacterized protein (UPF0371 family)
MKKGETNNEFNCFDSEKYIRLQSACINERIKTFNSKLYLEFGGKLLHDAHASRVLPGFRPGVKIEMLQKLKDKAEIIFCISANDIEKKKIQSSNNVSYDAELIRLVEALAKVGIPTAAVVITLYDHQPAAEEYAKTLKNRGLKTYFHTYTKGYPTDINTIVSEQGYGAQPYIKTTRPLVIVAAPGARSGKLATCLAQLYHEHQRGMRSGYAKYETFPVWNLPIGHPINLAYEASTADIGDIVMVDNYHVKKYGTGAVNYNRDLEVFPILKNILHKIVGHDIYHSPTDMGVNMAGECIIDDACIQKAAKDEIIRRYVDSVSRYSKGMYAIEVPRRIEALMDKLSLEAPNIHTNL